MIDLYRREDLGAKEYVAGPFSALAKGIASRGRE